MYALCPVQAIAPLMGIPVPSHLLEVAHRNQQVLTQLPASQYTDFLHHLAGLLAEAQAEEGGGTTASYMAHTQAQGQTLTPTHPHGPSPALTKSRGRLASPHLGSPAEGLEADCDVPFSALSSAPAPGPGARLSNLECMLLSGRPAMCEPDLDDVDVREERSHLLPSNPSDRQGGRYVLHRPHWAATSTRNKRKQARQQAEQEAEW